MNIIKKAPIEWSSDGLLDEISKLDKNMNDRSLAFILGAGASVTSGIPAATTLANEWLEEIHMRQCLDPEESINDWASKIFNEPLFNLTNAAVFYSKIFELRFGGDPQSGYAALEEKMDAAEPSLGYSILAKILSDKRHKVVVTTNFDNLVADALAIQALKSPLIVGHESLTGFVRPLLPRPLVAKIHRDLHLHPKNDQNGVDTLEKGWEDALTSLFQHYTPLVIGYGGNDGSLMGFLNRLPVGHIPGRLFWCYREGERPNKLILDIVEKHNGVIVAIAGFDEFMVQLALTLFPGFELNNIGEGIEDIGKQRAQRYENQSNKLMESLARADIKSSSLAVMKAKQSISEASHDPSKWWDWELKVQGENDPKKKALIYDEALSYLPESAEVYVNYAILLTDELNSFDKAGEMYRNAIKFGPADALFFENYAVFLDFNIKDFDAAEKMYKRALELDPYDNDVNRNYAIFLANNRKDYDTAEEMFKLITKLNPNDVDNLASYAYFLDEQRNDIELAEIQYKKLLEIEPDNTEYLGTYALFLSHKKRDAKAADSMYKKALEIDSSHVGNIGNYADFLATMNNNNLADTMFKRALAIDSANEDNIGSYAHFLMQNRRDYNGAEPFYHRLKNIDPSNVNYVSNWVYISLIKDDKTDLEQLRTIILEAVKEPQEQSSQGLAEILFYESIISELLDGEVSSSVIRLKKILSSGYIQGEWCFSCLYEQYFFKINEKRRDFYMALGEAILDANKVENLDRFLLWNDELELTQVPEET